MLNPLFCRRMEHCAMRTYLPSGERTPRAARNQRWVRYAHALVMRKHNGKPATKTPRGREQHHVNKYTLVRQRGQWLKMADRWASTASSNSVALQRGCFTKNPMSKSIDCSAEAIRRFSRPIRYWMKKLNRTQTHPTSYCNPAAHARWRLQYFLTYPICAPARAMAENGYYRTYLTKFKECNTLCSNVDHELEAKDWQMTGNRLIWIDNQG